MLGTLKPIDQMSKFEARQEILNLKRNGTYGTANRASAFLRAEALELSETQKSHLLNVMRCVEQGCNKIYCDHPRKGNPRDGQD